MGDTHLIVFAIRTYMIIVRVALLPSQCALLIQTWDIFPYRYLSCLTDKHVITSIFQCISLYMLCVGTCLSVGCVSQRAAEAQCGHAPSPSYFPAMTPRSCSCFHRRCELHWAAGAGRRLQKNTYSISICWTCYFHHFLLQPYTTELPLSPSSVLGATDLGKLDEVTMDHTSLLRI